MEEMYSDSGSGKAQPVVAALRSAAAERNLSKELLLRFEIGFRCDIDLSTKVQGGPSASGKIYVDIKFKVPSLA